VKRALTWIGVAAVATCAAALYWNGRAGAPEARYRTGACSRGSVSEVVTATGTISAVTTVQVGSQVSGIIARLHADFNSPVRSGQLLAELDPTPFEAQVQQRRADVSRAEVEARAAEIAFRRVERLLAEGLAPRADFDDAEANLDAARAQVEQAAAALRQSETNLRYTRILSPIDGVVVDRQYDVGQTVAASFQAPTLFTIAQDLTKMQVQADVDQADIGRIQVGQQARFSVDAYPEQEFGGEIAQIRLNATVNQNVISYPVILSVANPEGKLRPKMTANVTVVVATVEGALRVPNAALRFRPAPGTSGAGERDAPRGAAGEAWPGRSARGRGLAPVAEALGASAGPGAGRKQTVFVLRGPDVLEPVPVRTGITDGRHTAIVDGELREGDEVVIGLATTKVEASGAFPGAQPPGGRGLR